MCLGFVLTGSSKTHTHINDRHEARKFSSQFCRGGSHSTQGHLGKRQGQKAEEVRGAHGHRILLLQEGRGKAGWLDLGVTDLSHFSRYGEAAPEPSLALDDCPEREGLTKEVAGLWALDWLVFLIERHACWGVTCHY